MKDFVHLHVHSEYSLLDGLPKIKNLVAFAKSLEMNSVALTDHGVMFGAIEFYKECKAQGVKPLIGIETYIVNKDHKSKTEKEDKANNHLVLIAKDYEGYKNLMKITTIAHVEGFYYRPRIDKATLSKYSKGLIALSSCPKGELGQTLINGDYEKAKEVATWYQDLFGVGNYFVEIQRHEYSSFLSQVTDQKILERLRIMQTSEDTWVKGVIKLSRELAIPIVATNDVHYLRKEDAFAQDILVCVSTGKNVTDLDRLRYVDTPTFYMRTKEEMDQLFHDVPDALDNTLKVAEAVNVEIELGKWFFPKFEIPGGAEAPDYLRETAWEGFAEKYPNAEVTSKDRLQYELDVIIQKGYAPYFLMMADMVNWCTSKGIVTNTRGSAAGSCVSYVLGITTVDPIKYSLPFERFLNPFRPKPPDIDLDIADDKRDQLIAHLVEKYGSDKVAQICTFGRMLARAAVRDVGRTLGHPYSFPDKIAKLIPMGSQGFPMTIKHALEITPELKTLYDSDVNAKKVIDVAQEIEGNARQSSVHAAGTVVSPSLMTDFTPLQWDTSDTKIITQYEMHACEDVGLVKFDILGIRNLSILNSAVDIIEKAIGQKIDLAHLPLDDKLTFEMLARGETMGVFQLGGSGMTKWLKELRPNRIEDIMVMIALFRPGPMANIPEYIARKNKKSKVVYLHPKMENYLEKSYGILVYQEDILFTALELAGYNWETVDKLRVAIGKKIPAEMAKQHEIFVEGCQKSSGISKELAEKIWELFVPFQGYGFNKAHAASYGFVSYQTAYLKAHYSVEYMTALLSAESGDTDKITEGIEECRRMGIKVLPPDINKSDVGFTIEPFAKSKEGKAIRFGLSAIKNVGEAAINVIIEARNLGGNFFSLTEFCQRVNQKANKKVLESLIKVGAMDAFGKRSALLAGLEDIRSKCDFSQKQKDSGQTGLFDSDTVEQEKIVAKDTLPDIDELPKNEMLILEKELLGFYLTEHPLSGVLREMAEQEIEKIGYLTAEEHDEKVITIGGVVTNVRKTLTKTRNQEMAFVKIEDVTGSAEIVVFPKMYADSKDLWALDQVLLITGRVDFGQNRSAIIAEKVLKFIPTGKLKPKIVNYNEDDDLLEINLPRGMSPENLKAVKDLLKVAEGETKVILYIPNGETGPKAIELPFKISYTQDLKDKIITLIKNSSESV